MVVIRGRVEPQRALNGAGNWRYLLGLGRWQLEYIAKNGDGLVCEQGTVKADLNGCFVVAVDAPAPGTVEIRIKGRAVRGEDSCTVRVFSADDVVNLPRKLYPCNGHVRSASRVA